MRQLDYVLFAAGMIAMLGAIFMAFGAIIYYEASMNFWYFQDRALYGLGTNTYYYLDSMIDAGISAEKGSIMMTVGGICVAVALAVTVIRLAIRPIYSAAEK